MKKLKQVVTLLLAFAVLVSAVPFSAITVSAEDEVNDENLRACFDFSEETFLGRDGVVFSTTNWGSSGLIGVYGKDVDVVDGLNGNALQFKGTVSNLTEMATMKCKSAFYIRSDENLLEGDNVTINIVYKEDNTEQIQNIFYAGLTPFEYAAIKTSSTTENVGPQVSVNDSGAFAEQKISASAEVVPQAGTWSMLTVVQEGTVCKIYVNGTLVQTATMNYKLGDIASVANNNNYYALGAPSPYNDISVFMNPDVETNASYFDDPGFQGLIDDFRIYGAALSTEEIEELAVELNVVSPVGAQVESIEVVSGEVAPIIENTNGKWDERYNEETGAWEEFFYYEPDLGNVLVQINYTDGSSKTANIGDEIEGHQIAWESNQYEQPWVVGTNNQSVISYLGATVVLPIMVVSNALIGDVNSDGVVNAKDVAALRRYLAGGWDVTIDEAAADTNGDGSINAKDVANLRRYLAGGWGIELQ